MSPTIGTIHQLLHSLLCRRRSVADGSSSDQPKDVKGFVVNDTLNEAPSESGDSSGEEFVIACKYFPSACTYQGTNKYMWTYTCTCCDTFWSGPWVPVEGTHGTDQKKDRGYGPMLRRRR